MNNYQPDRFEDMYTLDEYLNRGGFAEVWRGTRMDTGEKFAIKVYDRTTMSNDDVQNVLNECRILQKLDHPNIIQFYQRFDSITRIHVVLELVEGGDLLDRIVRENTFGELKTREICRTLLEAIFYCHDNNIVHRDLKLDNILVTNHGNDFVVKLADFGLASEVAPDSPDSLTGYHGTEMYMAPEVLLYDGQRHGPYGPKVDLWGIGLITYTLLGGIRPFNGETRNEVLLQIFRRGLEFPMTHFGHVSGLAKKFICSLLNVPKLRLSVHEALEHPWFDAIIEENANQRSEANAFQKLKIFNAKRKLRSAIFTAVAVHQMRCSLVNTDVLSNPTETVNG